MAVVLALDIGTSSIKVAAIDANQGVVDETSDELPYLEFGVVDGEEVYRASARLISSLVARLEEPIAAVIASGQGDGLWGVGLDGEATRCYTWNSTFASAIVRQWQEDGTIDKVYRITGTVLWAGVSGALWRWLIDTHLHEAQQLGTVFTAKDWINYKLTGVTATDGSDATIPFMDTRTRTFSDEVFSLLGCTDLRPKIPDIRNAGERLGEVSAKAARETGLTQGTPVYMGSLDCVAAARGASITDEHDAVATLGTTSAVNTLSKNPIPGEEPVGASILWPDCDLTLRVLGSTSGSQVLEWFLATHGFSGHDRYDRFWEQVNAGEGHGEIFLPFLYGERVPFLSPTATGTYYGITAQTSISDLGRATIEGIVFSLRDCLESSGSINRLILSGGGTGSEQLCQLVADVLGRSVSVDRHPQVGLLGVASYVPGFETLSHRHADQRTYEPGRRSAGLNARYHTYKQLVTSLIPIWKDNRSASS